MRQKCGMWKRLYPNLETIRIRKSHFRNLNCLSKTLLLSMRIIRKSNSLLQIKMYHRTNQMQQQIDLRLNPFQPNNLLNKLLVNQFLTNLCLLSLFLLNRSINNKTMLQNNLVISQVHQLIVLLNNRNSNQIKCNLKIMILNLSHALHNSLL